MAEKKRPRKKRRATPVLKNQLFRIVAGMAILILLVVLAGYLTHNFVARRIFVKPAQIEADASRQSPSPQPHEQKLPAADKYIPGKPAFEIYPDRDTIPRKSPPDIPPELSGGKPRVAIIIDDLGQDRKMADRFMHIGVPLTLSILPHSPYTRQIADAAHSRGFETMLHLPMEPNEYPRINPGPGALLSSMEPDQLLDQLNRNLDAVPTARGVNNHMGSRLTTHSAQLNQIFSLLKSRDLYFIDSRTTRDTLCPSSAKLFKLEFAQRDVFLDHVQKPEFIRKQLEKLVKIAKSQGEAVGIAHPYPVTLHILESLLPELEKEVQLVPASRVVRVLG